MSHGRLKLAICTLLGALALAPAALANAPNPIPGTTKVDSYTVDAAGNRTVTIEGQWSWATLTNCPTARDGVGYQVAWFDGNTANPIGQNNSPNGVIDVGDAVDNMVHSLDNLDAANTNLAFNGLPSSYLTHNLTSSTPTQTDAQNWVSNCNNVDPVTQISSGTWGPISHTYPASYAGPIKLCPVMYDPHGNGTSSGGTIGSSGVGDLTAGGNGHNNDNSYEGNGQGVNGNNCLITSIPIVTTKASAGVVAGGQISDTATLSGGSSPTGTITFKLYRASDTTCSSPIGSAVSVNVTSGNGSYPMPAITENTAGSYQWVATYSGDANNLSISSACNDPNEQVTVSPAVPGIAIVKTQQLNGTNAGNYTSNPVSGHPGDVVDYKMVVSNTGNDALTTVSFSDPNCDGGTLSPSPAGLTLAVGASATFTCSHTLTNADVVNGSFTNTATASGADQLGTTVGPVSSSVVANVTPVAVPGITIVKTQQLNGTTAGAYASNTLTGHPGDTVDYRMIVSNTGNVSLTVTLSDSTCDSGSLAGTTIPPVGGTLAAGGQATFTCVHVLTSADLTAGSFINTASASGVDPLGQTVGPVSSSVEVDVTVTPAPAIGIVKQQELGGVGGFTASTVTGHPGDVVDYEMTVTNSGNDTLTIAPAGFADPNCDSGTLSGPSGTTTLAAGAQETWTCSHTLTSADLTAGSFLNTASVQATDPFGTPVGPVQSSVVANVTPTPAPGISVTKVQQINGTGAGGFTSSTLNGHAGDTVDYQMTVTNTGNDRLSIVNLADPNCDSGTLSGPSGSLAAGGQAVFTCSHVLTAVDLVAGSFTNTATATGQDQFGTGVGPVSSSVTVNVTPVPAPAIDLVKEQQLGGTTAGAYTTSTVNGVVGNTVDYEMIVTNTGNVALTATSFSDPKCDAGSLNGPSGAALAVGATATYTCSHVLTGADLTAGSLVNTATVSGTTASGATVGPVSKSVTADVAPKPVPAIDLVKAQQLNGTSAGAYTTSTLTGRPGDTIDYLLTVVNTGNDTLTIQLTDPQCDNAPSGSTDDTGGTLAAAAQATFTCSHLLTSADLTAGSFTNTATVSGVDAANTTVGPISKSVTVNVTTAPTPAIELVKAQQLNGTSAGGYTSNPVSGHVGDTVDYRMTATNTGNEALTLTFADPGCDSGTLSGPSGLTNGTLAAGAQAVWTCSHVLTAADLTAGSYTNTATLSGTTLSGTTVGPVSKSVVANLTPPTAPGIAIVKAQRINGTGSYTTSPVTVKPGDTIDYAMQVTNTGNVALTLSFSDPICDAGTLSGPTGLTNGTLAAGASAIYACTHLVTAADAAASSVKNTASVTGTTPNGTTVGPKSATVTATVTAPVSASSGMTVVKEQELAGSTSGFTRAGITVNVGQEIVYRITVTNTGGEPLALSFTDPHCDAGTLVGPVGQLTSDRKLAVGGTVSYWCTHLITTADQRAGSLTNTVSVVGTPPVGPPVGAIKSSVTASIPHALPLGDCTSLLGEIRLLGAIGGQRKPFTASVGSFGVKQVVFYLDRKRIATVGSAKGGRFSVRINPRKLSYGTHRVMAKITFENSNCANADRSGVFVHPKPAVVVPPFTG